MNAPPAACRVRPRDGASELTVLARSEWPASPRAVLPAIPGFIVSSFSPLAAELAQSCLRHYFGAPPADPERGQRTAIVLASTTGDIATAAAIASAVDHARVVPPLLFYQSNPNAVAGHIAARWGLAGPVVCTIPAGPGLADALESAALLIEDSAADAALVVLADQGGPDGDRGVALLVGPAGWLPPPGPCQGKPRTSGSSDQ
jgi:Beta-ketoacyl synthase, N-terminal domain